MSERELRLGLNEAVFREVNERIREVSERLVTGWYEEVAADIAEATDPRAP
jgi:hypothetical protein